MRIIKKLRLKKHLSQDKLAKLAGVSRSTIIAIEKDKYIAQPLTLQKIADALEVDLSEVDVYDKAK